MRGSPAGARLIGRTGAVAGRDFRFGDQARIGAARDMEIRIRADGVSRLHARVWREGSEYWVEDAGSTNGTFLAGIRIRKDRMRHLDVVTLGRDVDLIFVRDKGSDGEDAALPPVVAPSRVVSATLEPLDGPDQGTAIEIPRGEMTIGRAASNHLVAASQAVSKVHVRLERTADGVFIQDLDSTNGTWVNGTRINAVTVLAHEDRISLADARSFRVAVEWSGSAKAAQPPPTRDQVFNQEWRTRLIWSTEEIEYLEPAPPVAAEAPPEPPPKRKKRPVRAKPAPGRGAEKPAGAPQGPKLADASSRSAGSVSSGSPASGEPKEANAAAGTPSAPPVAPERSEQESVAAPSAAAEKAPLATAEDRSSGDVDDQLAAVSAAGVASAPGAAEAPSAPSAARDRSSKAETVDEPVAVSAVDVAPPPGTDEALSGPPATGEPRPSSIVVSPPASEEPRPVVAVPPAAEVAGPSAAEKVPPGVGNRSSGEAVEASAAGLVAEVRPGPETGSAPSAPAAEEPPPSVVAGPPAPEEPSPSDLAGPPAAKEASLVAAEDRPSGDAVDESAPLLSPRPSAESTASPAEKGPPSVRPQAAPEPTCPVVYLVGDERRVLEPGVTMMGRAASATIRIDDRAVSRTHATIVVTHGEAAIEDAGSINGTRVNGGLVTGRKPLRHGDRVQIGGREWTIEIART